MGTLNNAAIAVYKYVDQKAPTIDSIPTNILLVKLFVNAAQSLLVYA
jgi:hypothetical protein